MKHPDIAQLAQDAFARSGAKTHAEFCALFGGAIGLRSLRYWLSGDREPDPLARLVLREVKAGWLPNGQGDDR